MFSRTASDVLMHENTDSQFVAPVEVSNPMVIILRYIPLLHSAIWENSTNVIGGIFFYSLPFPRAASAHPDLKTNSMASKL